MSNYRDIYILVIINQLQLHSTSSAFPTTTSYYSSLGKSILNSIARFNQIAIRGSICVMLQMIMTTAAAARTGDQGAGCWWDDLHDLILSLIAPSRATFSLGCSLGLSLVALFILLSPIMAIESVPVGFEKEPHDPELQKALKHSPFGALLSRTLPNFSGTYHVGVCDVEAAVVPRLVGSFVPNKAASGSSPGFKLDTVLFTLFYPSEPATKSSRNVVWFPR